MNTSVSLDTPLIDRLATELSEQGYSILPQLLPLALTHDLYRRIERLEEHNALKPAGIGREQDFQLNMDIRKDETRWLTQEHAVEADYLSAMSALRLALNERLFLGLFDYEAHFAHYPPGAFYKRHHDAFQGQNSRILTSVLYLNPDWKTQNGGQLVIYHPDDNHVLATVEPELGTFVTFLSDQFPHEVLPSKVDRYSVSGWFRTPNPLQAPSI